MINKQLYQEEESLQFYEQRYRDGYMDSWPLEKKQRIFEVIRSLNLPERGHALDYGCGNGIFTDIIKQALPTWEVSGCDISEYAIENAKKLFPSCNFFILDDQTKEKFDFVFSHHVLEHVHDLSKILDSINNLLNPRAFILHILPCGNKDSFEHKICTLRKDGINSDMENRFFYEDVGHLRRLTSEELSNELKNRGFKLQKSFYANQYYGALRWISRSLPEFIYDFANPHCAKNKQAEKQLKKHRLILLLICLVQLPMLLWQHIWRMPNKKTYHYLLVLLNLIPTLISYPFFKKIDKEAKREWDTCKNLPNGSEMYLFFAPLA